MLFLPYFMYILTYKIHYFSVFSKKKTLSCKNKMLLQGARHAKLYSMLQSKLNALWSKKSRLDALSNQFFLNKS
jgi:hypothetical protein